jgi:hypothetical protein
MKWNPPAPRELAGVREELARACANPLVYENTVLNLAQGRGTVTLTGVDPGIAAAVLLAEERRRLRSARLYSITDEMSQICIAAGKKLPTWEIRREDVPSTCGLMMFDVPIGHYSSEPEHGPPEVVSIVAVSWGPTNIPEEPADHLWVTFWSRTPHDAGIRMLQERGLSLREARRIQYSLGDYSWDNEVLLTYNNPEVSVINADGEAQAVDPSDKSLASGTTIEWIQAVRAAWMLMKQETKRPISDVEELPLSKTVRKQLQRNGYDADPVRVVTLHRQHQVRTSHEHASGYTVKVRSHVSGHVRWQPYPTRGVIEPIWIADHVRGPDGAPWSQRKTTVTRVDRPPGGRPPVDGK